MTGEKISYWDADVFLSNAAYHIYSIDDITSLSSKNNVEFTLFVSCYNEQDFILDTFNQIMKAMEQVNKSYEIIVIDDCSKDNSVEIIKKFIVEHPEINIILRVNKKNKGLGQNYIDGAFIGSGKYYRLICGDDAEPFETIATVLSCAGDADIIVPYHLTAVEGKSKFRNIVSRMYTVLFNLISGNNIKYYNGLHLHLRLNVMRWHPNTRGFAFQASLLCILLKKGFTCKQVPCIAIDRRVKGANAITWKNLRSVAHTLTSILLHRIMA
jgi:glycosyltransferase involved in cell wall biosynthesis